MYGTSVLSVSRAQFLRYAFRLKCREDGLRATERPGSKKAVCVVTSSFRACELTSDFRCVKEDEKCSQYEEDLLANPSSPNVELLQNKTFSEDDLVDSSLVFLVATRKTRVSKELSAQYHKRESVRSVPLDFIWISSVRIKKTFSGKSSV